MDETMTARTDVEGIRVAASPARIAARCAVGYDGSAASVTALVWAVARAIRSAGEVQLVGVVDDDSGAMGAAYAEQSAHDLGALLSAAAARVANAHPGLVVTTRRVSGAVAPALAAAVRADDVLVVGSAKTGYARGRL